MSNTASAAAAENEQDQSSFHNKFSALSLGQDKDEEAEEDVSSDYDSITTQQRVQMRRTGKGKKGKRSKRSKPKVIPAHSAQASLTDIPVESYRIIEDKDGIVSDYLLAIYAVVQEWIDLRLFTQDLWREAAYDELNAAVVASLNSMAVAVVQQTCIAVFSDFPGHESYDTIIQTITRGNPDKAQSNFRLDLNRVSACGDQAEKAQGGFLDVKEQFWINTYNDLVGFISDYQQNRTGKPTKAMQKQLND